MKKYLFQFGQIKEAELIKDAPKTLVLRVGRVEHTLRKACRLPAVFDSWEAAHEYAVGVLEKNVEHQKRMLAQVERQLILAKSMKAPTQ